MVKEKPKTARGRRSQIDTAFRRWREAKQLTLREMAAIVNEVEPTLSTDFGMVQHVEENGTYDVRWIRGISLALGVTESQVEEETRRLRSL
jgi:transcriptional regulator with XRE-family HTH domain